MPKLDRSEEIADWARKYPDKIVIFMAAYDDLIKKTNGILDLGFVPESAMPKIARLQQTLVDKRLPRLDELGEFDLLTGLRQAKEPMLTGQKIKKGEIQANNANTQFAIGTTSMDTTPDALAVGTIGHLLERALFVKLSQQGLEPVDGWSKDDILQALDEALMLGEIEMQKNDHPLKPYFFRSNKEGGPGWLNDDKLTNFRREYFSALRNTE